MLKRFGCLIVMGAAVVAAGCLQKETTHTLYISPDDQVAWVAIEGDVQSDEADPGRRFAEELDYLTAAIEGRHRIAKGLTALAPGSVVRTHVLRDERPFRVQIDARLGGIDHVLQQLFKESGLQASVLLTRDGVRTTLGVQFDFGVPIVEVDHPVTALMDDFASFKLVLTEGTFAQADGWDVSGGAASLSKEWLQRSEEASQEGGRIELWLSWDR